MHSIDICQNVDEVVTRLSLTTAKETSLPTSFSIANKPVWVVVSGVNCRGIALTHAFYMGNGIFHITIFDFSYLSYTLRIEVRITFRNTFKESSCLIRNTKASYDRF